MLGKMLPLTEAVDEMLDRPFQAFDPSGNGDALPRSGFPMVLLTSTVS
jgi:hypothetical protein